MYKLKQSFRVVDYFAHVSPAAFCDGDACVIAGSRELMEKYLVLSKDSTGYVIEKTRFREIYDGLIRGGAYAFDKNAYQQFFAIAKLNKLLGLPAREVFSEFSEVEAPMHFIRLQCLN